MCDHLTSWGFFDSSFLNLQLLSHFVVVVVVVAG